MILSIAPASPANGTIRLHLAGDLDLSTVAILSQANAGVLNTRADSIIVDLADAAFCDCAGLPGCSPAGTTPWPTAWRTR